MKNKISPTSVEKKMREEDFIVSKTDLTGKIIYGNRIFIEFSGFTEKELLNKQHSIIRHPDMPRGVFKFLWDTIQAGNECFAYVKNMSKDGSFYWVFANVTPSFDIQGNMIGYFSVRRKPKSQAITTMTEVYRAMLAAEKRVPPRDACNTSLALLTKILAEKGVSYEEFILTL
ncbi:Aerotaxis receptor Aer [Gammaproteobacteria bacterium]